MAFCIQCGAQLPENVSFCPSCGQKVAEAEPVYTAQAPVYEQPAPQAPVYEQPASQQPTYEQPQYQPPVYQQPQYQYAQQPVYTAQPVVETKFKVMGYIGMGLGIGALFFGFLATILSLVGLGYYGYESAVLAITYGILAAGLGVPAKILAAKALGGGFVSTPAKLGNIFGLVGIIAGGTAFMLGVIGVM